jgi:hypothetical protein
MKYPLRVSLILSLVTILGISASISYGKGRPLGTITGSVNDHTGKPIAGVLVTILREGANEVIKQTRTGANGSYSARVMPGRYSLRAFAVGFNEVFFPSVQVSASSQLIYRFNLEPSGSGKTLPEQRKDRDDTKWRMRSAQNRRSIFQIQEEESQTTEQLALGQASSEDDKELNDRASKIKHRPQGVLEFYSATSPQNISSHYSGINFAFDKPINDDINLIFAGQTGIGRGSPQRFETTTSIRINDHHRFNISVAGMQVNPLLPSHAITSDKLGQLSLRAVDEWVLKNGVVVVLGLDYSRFVGTSRNHYSLSPRVGLQFDANALTRLKISYAPAAIEPVQSEAMFEDVQVQFIKDQPRAITYTTSGEPVMERSRRLEFGVERILDERSSIEASAFFDTTTGRGIGIFTSSLSAFSNDVSQDILRIANQEGATRGLRLIYIRRISSKLKASAGYSFGKGQELSPAGITSPANILNDAFFQTVAAQIDADISDKTRLRTVYRFSPKATVFAIDPLAGRLAVYDPSLSILLMHELPTFGLPVRVDAIVDARNILDMQPNIDNSKDIIYLGPVGRTLRGGIAVRF